MNTWNLVSEKVILKAKLFEVKELKIKEGSRDITHHIAERHPTVSVFPVSADFDIYLVSQYRYMLKKQTLEAMAGFIDIGESPLEAAKRELKEETGITANDWKKLTEVEMAASVFRAINYIYLARDLSEGIPQNEEGEDITLVKMSLEEAVDKAVKGEINHSSSVVGIMLIDKLKRDKKL